MFQSFSKPVGGGTTRTRLVALAILVTLMVAIGVFAFASGAHAGETDSVTTFELQADSDKTMSIDGSRVAMFRLYNEWTGEHLYTSSISERDSISNIGWKYEKIEWYAPTSTNMKPVYRLYNPYVVGGDHHYTTDATERDNCVKAGWTYEGEGWRTVTVKTETDYVDVLRQYNPYATTGTHNYSTDPNEVNGLVKVGWEDEGLGWGGYSRLESSDSRVAFAVYSADDSSLNFYKRATVPSEGSSFNGKTATKVYTGIENFTPKTTPGWAGYQVIPYKSVTIVDNGIQPVSMYSWFYGGIYIEEFNGLEKLNTSKTTDMGHLFEGCFYVKKIDGIKGWDTFNVRSMVCMFYCCRSLTSLDISQFDTSNVTDMSDMFGYCSPLISLDVSHFNTSRVTDMDLMFQDCSSLKFLDVSSWDTSNVISMMGMFMNCGMLETDCSQWNVAKVEEHKYFNQYALGVVQPNWIKQLLRQN